jgi:ribokinase
VITVVGSVNLDLIATVDRLPHPGETVRASGFSTAGGGKGANQALAAARAGARVRLVGAVGDDAFAAQAIALIEESGVDLTGVERVRAPTGTALILVDGTGENMIAVVPGANETVSAERIGACRFGPGDQVVLQQEIPLPAIRAALAAARRAGAFSILNAAPFREESAELLSEADLLVVNETEFDLCAEKLSLAGSDREACMRAFVAKTRRGIIVTMGSRGVSAATPELHVSVPALPVVPLDTVGAGDTFVGYLAAGLAEGLGLERSLRRAAAAASLACLGRGAQPAIPTASAVEAAMGRHAAGLPVALTAGHATTLPGPQG